MSAAAEERIARRRRLAGVGALAFLLLASVGWWALALWPVADDTPDWLARTRAVCFNAGGDGLPDASGWILLVGQPIGMLAVLMVIWGPAVRAGLRGLAAARAGRAALALCVVLLGAGLVAAGARVVSARGPEATALPTDADVPDTWPRLDREAPRLGLVDQHGDPLDLERLAGRPALVTFAFGHCETVCPMVVRQTVEAQQRVAGRAAAGAVAEEDVPRVVVVTLDPWRDTPTRLQHIATHWKATQETFVLSGDVETVNGVLDAWNVARRRDPQTGDVTHPPLVYVLDPLGRIAYAASGGVETLVELLDRTGGRSRI